MGPVSPKPQTLRRWRERIAAALLIPDVEERLNRAKGQKGTAIKELALSWSAIVAEARKQEPKLWPPDVLRHSYASHWLPAYKNEHDLAQQMGNSPSVIHRHYRGLVTESEAKRYWAISPERSC
jgi:integrase